MRKLLALLLLSTVATPALADPGDTIRRHDNNREARSERQDSPRETRSHSNSSNEQSQSGGNDGGGRHDSPRVRADVSNGGNDGGNQSQPALRMQRGGANDAPQVHAGGNDGGNATPRRVGNWRQVHQDSGGGEQPAVVQDGGDDGSTNTRRTLRMEDRVRVVRPQIVEQGDVSRQPGQPGLRQLERPLPRVMQGRTPVISRTPREGTQPPLRVENRRRNSVNWTSWKNNWRNDRRYDWKDHRRRHRSIFRVGIYFDPFGWNYRPYSIGWRLWPSYYSSRYWINDPWFYRLPYAPPGYRWVRYWDDALLVDTFTGEVVDVIHNFFW
jgi:Ni/Co efflux regulator RcnB